MAKLSDSADLDLIGQARVHPRRLQRADQGRRHRRRHAHPGVAADDPVRARARRARWSWPAISAGRRASRSRSSACGRSPTRLAELARAAGDVRRRLHRRGAKTRVDQREAHRAAASCCSRTCASTPRKRRTTRVRGGAGVAGRPVRRRRVRRGAPGARVGRGDHAPFPPGRGRPADGAGAAVSRPRARGAGAAVRRDPRRREGVGQDRGDREPAAARSIG